ncbi:MAG: hypothetical protein QXH20_06430 [Candidatus Bathyarchaeia archaeon]
MDTKKLMATFAILIIALGIAGFAYAHWSEYLWLEGEVTTGKLCMEWSLEYEVWPGNTKRNETGHPYLNVSNVGHRFVDKDEDGCYEGLVVWVNNAYPSLWINGTLDVHNCGTIPARLALSSIRIEGKPEGWWEKGIELKTQFRGDLNQIDPCGSLYLDFYIHFTQAAPENAWLKLYIDLTFVEWNAPA